LARTAAFLGRRSGARKGLPGLLFFTDPARTPDPEAVARRLPPGAAIVFRSFGAPDAEARGARLKAIASERKLLLLIGADAAMAGRVGADGVHLPERLAHRARRLKAAHPGWIVTAAAHSPAAARRALAAGADAVVVSAVFPSRSASAGAPIGPLRLAILVRRAGGPVYALGGVDNKKARLLKDTGLIGLAAVGAFRT
jgi:thiamine-phosphate pyrophosphorylase